MWLADSHNGLWSQWRDMSARSSQITRNSTFVQELAEFNNKVSARVPHYWSFVKGIHRWPVDYPRKGPVMGSSFPYRDVIISNLQLMLWFLSRLSTSSWWGLRLQPCTPSKERHSSKESWLQFRCSEIKCILVFVQVTMKAWGWL